MNKEYNEKELELADQVADELLIREKRINVFIWLFLLIFVLLLSVFSALVFAKVGYIGRVEDNYIKEGSVLFSYEEGDRTINIVDAMPTPDDVGKKISGDNESFTFSIAAKSKTTQKPSFTYEISLTPKTVTLDPKYVRVYLLEGNKEVKTYGHIVNSFTDLSKSQLREDGSRLLFKETLQKDFTKTFTIKVWLDENYNLPTNPQTFSFYVNVDAY